MYQSVHKFFISKHHTQCKEAQLLGPVGEIKIIFNPFICTHSVLLCTIMVIQLKKKKKKNFHGPIPNLYTTRSPHLLGQYFLCLFAFFLLEIKACVVFRTKKLITPFLQTKRRNMKQAHAGSHHNSISAHSLRFTLRTGQHFCKPLMHFD